MADPFSFIPSSVPVRSSAITSRSQSKNNNNTSDAFHDLVSFDVSASINRQTSNLTLAERAAKAEQDRKTRLNNDTRVFAQDSFWDKFDNSSIPAPSKGARLTSNVPPSSADDKPQAATSAKDSWDIDFISLASSSKPPPDSHFTVSRNVNTDLLDSDDIPPLVDFRDSFHPSTLTRSDTPGSFDFADHDEHYENDKDDILGDLGKPIELVKRIASEERLSFDASRQPVHTRPPSSSSPPPHVLGKLVEMGFSIQQAKKALVKTSMDVDAAVELLLQDTVDMPFEGPDNTPLPPERDRRRPAVPSHSPPSNSQDSVQALQDQADRLISQASSIGFNMFSKANSLWKESREKVIKVYEEQRLGVSNGQDKAQTRTRPRWMEDQASPENHARLRENATELPPIAYKSPSRHRVPHTSDLVPSIPEPIPSLSRISPKPKPISSVSRPSPPPPAITRPNIEVSAFDLAVSNAAKMKGTEHFKLGRFAEAEASYSRALAALPESHSLRVSLYNNRALTRIKIGEYKAGIEDATMVIKIVIGDLGSSWHPSRESQDGAALAQAVAKAYRRRAEAYEGLERWEDARADWETLNSSPWVEHSNKTVAVNGITRCRRMLSGDVSNSSHKPSASTLSSTMAKPVKFKPSASSASTVEGSALSRVRTANLTQEKEEQERHELKDSVDGRLEAWKSGKEKNIRALIASLETILPPKFNWKSVGMSELVTSNQVKVRYMKAIARLHPDKLSTNDTSVEERMIANGVFGVLNEAWNSLR